MNVFEQERRFSIKVIHNFGSQNQRIERQPREFPGYRLFKFSIQVFHSQYLRFCNFWFRRSSNNILKREI
jgi:hypothetical protein